MHSICCKHIITQQINIKSQCNEVLTAEILPVVT
ncbi:hypothetical protein MAMMFC1_00438 [Methylomusa anaerophila]|uniref:Uncharacterized protein n=1 Tax=Methylomusa anaerophila TaxID=1930071 RepID=A0A348AFF6_9FIRM|nr:hypothetical protein MAMMFC1_00438 [Methylomusa anaerophila]